MAPRTIARVGIVGIWLLAAIALPASAGESYYVLIFGSQSQPKRLKDTHTWATFVRAVGEGTDPANYQVCAHTISWMPASLEIKVWRPTPEPGVNLSLEQSLATVYAHGEQVILWGPFVITPDLYNRSVEVYNTLNGGRVQYRAISARYNLLVSDCIHAVAAVDPRFGRGHYPLVRTGHSASRYIARELVLRSPDHGIAQESYDNTWLIPRLGLDRYPISVVTPQMVPQRPCGLCRHPE